MREWLADAWLVSPSRLVYKHHRKNRRVSTAAGGAAGRSPCATLLDLCHRVSLGAVVKPPFVNLEERIDRMVGRRTRTPNALSVKTSNKADAIAWRKSFGGVRVPRGVHRFRTHEEADEWLWRMICRPTPS